MSIEDRMENMFNEMLRLQEYNEKIKYNYRELLIMKLKDEYSEACCFLSDKLFEVYELYEIIDCKNKHYEGYYSTIKNYLLKREIFDDIGITITNVLRFIYDNPRGIGVKQTEKQDNDVECIWRHYQIHTFNNCYVLKDASYKCIFISKINFDKIMNQKINF
jgi:hypothetical protein